MGPRHWPSPPLRTGEHSAALRLQIAHTEFVNPSARTGPGCYPANATFTRPTVTLCQYTPTLQPSNESMDLASQRHGTRDDRHARPRRSRGQVRFIS